MHGFRIGVLAATVALLGLTALAGTAAGDQGNWTGNGCNSFPAAGCAYRILFNHAPVEASQYRDSTFTNDYYADGVLLNDNVKYFRNTFDPSTPLCLYQNSNYVTPRWVIAGGSNTNALPVGTSSGASSFKSC